MAASKLVVSLVFAQLEEILKDNPPPEVLEELRALATKLGLVPITPTAVASHPSREWLTAKEAADLFGLNKSWLYRNWRRLPFAQKLLDGPVRFNREGLATWDGKEKENGAGADLSTDVSVQDSKLPEVRRRQDGAPSR